MIPKFGKSVVTPATEYPITLAQALAQAYGDDDLPTVQTDLMTAIIATATLWAEDFCCSRFVTQTWDYFFDRLPYDLSGFEIPYGPLQSITSISYLDISGTTQTLSSTLYGVDTTSFIPSVYPAWAAVWPAIRPIKNAVTIRAVQGYGSVASGLIPPGITHAIKILANHYYNLRDQFLEDSSVIEVPMMAKTLLMPHRKSFV